MIWLFEREFSLLVWCGEMHITYIILWLESLTLALIVMFCQHDVVLPVAANDFIWRKSESWLLDSLFFSVLLVVPPFLYIDVPYAIPNSYRVFIRHPVVANCLIDDALSSYFKLAYFAGISICSELAWSGCAIQGLLLLIQEENYFCWLYFASVFAS